MRLPLDQKVVHCISLLEQAGYEAWLVGGSVRDLLLGRPAGDADLASSASPQAVCSLFERVIETGVQHGTVTVLLDGLPIEVTQYRVDGAYLDGRHPSEIRPASSIREDLSRRDFTVNAMAYHPVRGLFDPFQGQEDLRRGLIRCVGDARTRFHEDALRILRAFRLSAQLNFDIEEATRRAALDDAASLLSHLSAERVYRELCLTLLSDQPQRLEPLLWCGGLEPFGLEAKKASLSPLGRVDPVLALRLCLLCLLCGADVKTCCARLKTDRRTASDALLLTAELGRPLPPSRAEIKRRLGLCGVELFFLSLKARALADPAAVCDVQQQAQQILHAGEPFRLSMLAVSGQDLTALGLRGPDVGILLRRLLEHVLDHPEDNQKEPLLALCRQWSRS